MLAVRTVALLKITLLTVTPGPRLTVEAAVKFVFDPVIVVFKVCPC